MKNLLILILFFLCSSVFAQNAFFIKSDTLKGADTIEFRTSELTGTNWLVGLQADIEYISNSSSNDTIYGEASVNGISYARLASANGNVVAFPNTKMALNGASPILIGVVGVPFPNFGFTAYGVAGDTCVISTWGITKE